MASYKKFEEVPAWRDAIALASAVFELTGRPAFKYRGDLVNQIRRASLSVSNNIAEGFERGSTRDLINFLYIARGSCGESRSMMRFALTLGGLEGEKAGIEDVAARCANVSKQLFGWIESLKNTEIQGDRYLTDQERQDYARREAEVEIKEKFGPQQANLAVREGRYGEFLQEKMAALRAARTAAAERAAGTSREAPSCGLCGTRMVKRHDRNGRPFWGCANYPRCKGSRSWQEA